MTDRNLSLQLINAVQQGSLPTIKQLLIWQLKLLILKPQKKLSEAREDTQKKDKQDRTPLDLAQEERKRIESLLPKDEQEAITRSQTTCQSIIKLLENHTQIKTSTTHCPQNMPSTSLAPNNPKEHQLES